MDVVIKNGKIVNTTGIVSAGIAIDKEKIVAIARDEDLPKADKVIDAKGNYILPGLVDDHTHHGFVEPFAQTCMTETKASALGGVTTVGIFCVFEAPISTTKKTTRENSLHEVFNEWKSDFETNTIVDGFFHGTVNNEQMLSEIPICCTDLGISSFKFAMGYKGPQAALIGVPPAGIDDGFVFEAFKIIGKAGGLGMVHAENIDIALRLRRGLEHRQDVRVWHDSRPNFVEEECINRAIFIAKVAECPLWIAHNTIGESVDIFAQAKFEGKDVLMETCPQYLTHNSEEPLRPILKENPTFAVVNPPLRGKWDNDKLWQGIKDGVVDCVGSDQAPQTKASKGRDMWQAGMGTGNGTQIILPVMLSEGVNKNRISLENVVEVCCYKPAKIFGLYPRKGTIDVGSDADIVIVDLDKKVKWTVDLSPSVCDWSIYDGWEFKGFPVLTMLRGKVIVEEGKVIAEPGYGRYIHRKAR